MAIQENNLPSFCEPRLNIAIDFYRTSARCSVCVYQRYVTGRNQGMENISPEQREKQRQLVLLFVRAGAVFWMLVGIAIVFNIFGLASVMHLTEDKTMPTLLGGIFVVMGIVNFTVVPLVLKAQWDKNK